MGKRSCPLRMTEQERNQLDTWVRAKTAPQRVAFRAQICLLAAEGLSATEIAQRMHTSRPTVLLWKKRFDEQGPDGLARDAPRGPSSRKLDAGVREAIVDATLNNAPEDGSQWTTRTLAKALGISNATVARVWKAYGIKRSRKRSGTRAKEREAQQKISELVGVYVFPPLRALVVYQGWASTGLRSAGQFATAGSGEDLSYAEASSEGHRCDSCLSAALDMLEGVIPAHADKESGMAGLLTFLHRIDREAPDQGCLHLFLEQRGSDAASLMEQWVKSPERVQVHIFPGGFPGAEDIQSEVERLTGYRPIGTASNPVPDLVVAADHFIRTYNGGPRPFVWTRQSTPATEDPERCKAILETMRQIAVVVAALLRRHPNRSHAIRAQTEDPMSWKEKLESWFAAAAFAEEGEHATAMQIAETPIPEVQEIPAILPSLSTVFAAAAFAEENCHDTALEILQGTRRRNSFLEAVGLARVRVWHATAALEQSFAEAVGLGGARYRLLSIPL